MWASELEEYHPAEGMLSDDTRYTCDVCNGSGLDFHLFLNDDHRATALQAGELRRNGINISPKDFSTISAAFAKQSKEQKQRTLERLGGSISI